MCVIELIINALLREIYFLFNILQLSCENDLLLRKVFPY